MKDDLQGGASDNGAHLNGEEMGPRGMARKESGHAKKDWASS